MFTTQLKLGAAALVASCTIAIPSVLAWQDAAGSRPSADFQKAAGDPQKTSTGRGGAPDAAKDFAKDASPAGSGPQVLLTEQALQILDRLKEKGEAANPEDYDLWSRRALDARLAAATSRDEKTAALKAYIERLSQQKAAATALHEAARGTMLGVLNVQYRLNEAEKWLAEAEAGPPEAAKKALGPQFPVAKRPSVAKPAATPADEERNRAIQAKLNERVSMNFPNATPLEDVLKYIGQCTQDEKAGLPNGIPIYVDPNGLKQAGATMASTVSLNLEGIPLRTTLRLMLGQLGLIYKVEDGLLYITDDPEKGFKPRGNP
jgi:hypothetical protein